MEKQYSRNFIIELTTERYANIRPQYAVELENGTSAAVRKVTPICHAGGWVKTAS